MNNHNRINIGKVTMFNVRIKIDNDEIIVGNSEPCHHCCKQLRSFGFKNIYYTDYNSTEFKLSYLDNNFITSGDRKY